MENFVFTQIPSGPSRSQDRPVESQVVPLAIVVAQAVEQLFSGRTFSGSNPRLGRCELPQGNRPDPKGYSKSI